MKLYFETSNFPWAPERYHYSAEQMMLTLFPEERPEYPEGLRDMSGEKNAAVFTLHRGKKLTNLSVLVFRPQGYYNGVTIPRRLPLAIFREVIPSLTFRQQVHLPSSSKV